MYLGYYLSVNLSMQPRVSKATQQTVLDTLSTIPFTSLKPYGVKSISLPFTTAVTSCSITLLLSVIATSRSISKSLTIAGLS